MKKFTIKTGTATDFFRRGKLLAKLADAGKELPNEAIVSFEDSADLLRLLTQARLALFRAVKEQPDSITGISERLPRDRSAVKRDVDILEKVGMVSVESKILQGHGRMKEVRVTAQQFRLEANLV